MGCGGSKNNLPGVHKPLECWMEWTSISEVDGPFWELRDALYSLEEIREILIDDRDDVLEYTGACSYKEGNLYKAALGMLWKLSADNKGDILKAEIVPDDKAPYMRVDGKNISTDGRKSVDYFLKYVGGLIDLKDKLESTSKSVVSGGQKLIDSLPTLLETAKTKLSSTPLKM
jgi:hypothetical protein